MANKKTREVVAVILSDGTELNLVKSAKVHQADANDHERLTIEVYTCSQ